MTKKVFIKTFGCQMNEYDSDKMADVMNAAQGYEPTQDVEEADLILFNTCSVREKAQEKVFSDLGRVKHLKAKGVLIGVGGCVASQEGAAIIERAPYVDVVFGPQTLHRLPQLLDARWRQVVELLDLGKADIHLRAMQARALFEQMWQAVQRLWAEHHVDIRRALNDGRAFLAGHAAAHADQHALGLQVLHAAQVAEDLLLSLLAHRAGVEENQVGFVDVLRRLVAFGDIQNVRHLVRVVLVHLAAEGFDKKFFTHDSLLK